MRTSSLNLEPPGPGRPYAIINGAAGQAPVDLVQEDFIDAYKTYGALLLRGFDMSLPALTAFTQAYCSGSVFNESMNRDVLDAENNVQTVNLGDRPFPLHPELSREPWKPDICFFYCINAPRAGGETTICDGVEIVKNLPPAVVEALRHRRLRYEVVMDPHGSDFWLGESNPTDEALAHPPKPTPYVFRRLQGKVLRAFSRPALHKPMFTDELAFGNFLLFSRFMNNRVGYPCLENGEPISDQILLQIKQVSDRLTAPIPWRPGDVAILDNTRFMHGRNQIIDQSERLIASFFGYLKFAVPDPEEMPNPPWRKGGFVPPSPLVAQARVRA